VHAGLESRTSRKEMRGGERQSVTLNECQDGEEDRKRTGADGTIVVTPPHAVDILQSHAKTLDDSRENDRILKSIQTTVSILVPFLPLPPSPKLLVW
jgi:hypothetical protein